MEREFNGIFQNLTVLVTGHTGFKGAWLTLWLEQLGARVIGYSLDPPTTPSLFDSTNLASRMISIKGDIRDKEKLAEVFSEHQPQLVFHLAAQALVYHSYQQPAETFEVNAQGTVNILEAARLCSEVKALIMVTTDKCYDNREWIWGYRETDHLGGNDPYSASKGMAELAIHSYRYAFFREKGPYVASVRAGNVIGGGDFSAYRIIPDCMKALMAKNPIEVRNPLSIRPWFNVLDPLSGYLWLAASLLKEGPAHAEAWNFGPLEQKGVSVQALVEETIKLWGVGSWQASVESLAKPEMNLLRLNWDKAAHRLHWHPVYNWKEAIKETVDWFKAYEAGCDIYTTCLQHIEEFTAKAKQLNLRWSSCQPAIEEIDHLTAGFKQNSLIN